uniref:Nudix hydrolase domain-containing protein n=1 Tax=viral metagenome TaxID=1070528 RepID=A0A6C0KY67_9ZZZZ
MKVENNYYKKLKYKIKLYIIAYLMQMGSANGCIKHLNESKDEFKHSESKLESESENEYEYKGVVLKAAYPHIEKYMKAIRDSPKLQFWLDEFDFNALEFSEFKITDVDFFGPIDPNRLGFYKGTGKVINRKTKEPIPAIAFNRGECVACLIVVTVKETRDKYVVMCEQLRFAAGRHMKELPAGMKDSRTRSLKGPILDEIAQETGIIVNEDDNNLKKLGKKIYPSPGGCDEAIDLWLYETDVTKDKMREMLTNTFGCAEEYEKIKLHLIKVDEFDDLLDEIGDVKAECAWRRYKNLKK